jgi:hypothetical protein
LLRAKGNSKHLSEARQHDSKDIQIWQNGIWDNRILCDICDGSFSPWDNYGFRILGNPPGNNILPQNDAEMQAFVIKNIKYDVLKLFILSLLWRASVSTVPFFSRIQLGAHQSEIAEMIRNKNPGRDDQFPVVVNRLVFQKFPNAIFPPYSHASPEGIDFNVIFLPSIKIMVKTDHRPLPQILEPIALKPRRDNIAMPVPLSQIEIRAFEDAAEIFRNARSKHQ